MKKKTKKKKIIIICFLIVLILLSGMLIFLGIYLTKLTKPNYIFGVGIDKLDNKIVNYTSVDSKYDVGDSISIDASLTFDLDSEDYLKKSKTDNEFLGKYKTLKNLNATTNNINLIQDIKDKEFLLEVNSSLNEEKLINYKYLIENSTGYYYLEDVLNKYVNEGTNNYFEMFNDDNSTKENVEYVHEASIKALKSSIHEDYFDKKTSTETIGGSTITVNCLSIRIDDKRIHNILNETLKNLRNDEKANQILTSIDKDFSKYKIKNSKEILKKQESYTINIYTSKYRNTALKYEIVHLNGDEKKTYSYEGNTNKGTFYYIEDDTVIYSVDLSDDGKIIEGKINDSTSKEIGAIKIERNDTGTYFTFDFDDGIKKYNAIYSSKNTNLKDNKSFSNEKQLSFKYIENKVSIISGTITLNSEITNKATIEEDTGESVLYSTLSEEVKNKYSTKKDRLKERLKK